MPRKTIHVCLDVRGALMNWVPSEWNGVITDDSGKKLSAREAKMALLNELAQGHFKLPFGDPCEGFDYGENGGCPGHPVPDEEVPDAEL
jgi:hypothetical protein